MKPLLIYCFDAYCGWCYGFSPVIKQIAEDFSDKLVVEVLSGGMILPETPVHIGKTAAYISEAYKSVEAATGVTFGSDYLWHIFNHQDSDWFPHSEMPAIALCIFKEFLPERAVQIAGDIQYALHFEGRDLTDKEAYRHLTEKYGIDSNTFYQKLSSTEYKEKANYEFALCKQLKVSGFPCVFIQTGQLRFEMVARGYTPYEMLKERVEKVLAAGN